jgi:hypothetical protein
MGERDPSNRRASCMVRQRNMRNKVSIDERRGIARLLARRLDERGPIVLCARPLVKRRGRRRFKWRACS